ncbi:MAG: SPOR domain-containing protein [Ferrovibrio sp.]|uniref:SPOR domain-containing protein n=1 Tax=Ferrovibrio sp. TaxID=1917215 RepID=UPI00261C6512|nr:SPOR domain-containing protein [Ferrovibrio sp.]MCW0232661.1 SPOR domain-containing protein [Ferrovibrio sp.]
MRCRNVIALILAAGLLAGCEAWQRTQMELGMYPVDPPRPETPMPPPGSVSQANWAAQRATSGSASQQGNTAPVNYQDPEKLAAEAEAARMQADRLAAAKAPAPGSKPAAPMPRAAANRPAAGTSSSSAAVPPGAAPMVVAGAPGLPAGYKPSPAAADDPKLAMEQQKMAAATGAVPEPPAMAGSMKNMAGAEITGWRAHLASHRTESAAINEWQELLRGNQALYGQFDPQVEWVDTPSRGSFARLVLVGFAERKDADAACAKIRSSTRYCASVKD